MTKRSLGAIVVAILTASFLLFYYSGLILNADKLAFGKWGDGYKNYYTLAYYLKYDHGSHFSGMDYPYGENVVFTDNQPAIAWLLKFFVHFFPSLSGHIHAWLTLSIFLSILLSAFILYYVLLELDTGIICAIIFACLTAMLTPQMPRLNAHFSLGLSCYLPVLLWLLVKYFKTSGKWIYAAGMAALISFFGFIHIYYLAMAAFFILFIAIVFFTVNIREWRKYTGFTTGLLLSIILPFAVLKTYLVVTDPVTDRPQNPWGYTTYYSTPADIFLHPYSFTGELAGRLLPPNVLVYHGEGTGYIGFTTVLLLAAVIILCVYQFRRTGYLLSHFYPLNYFFVPAIVVLFFAMAIPLGFPSFGGLYDRLPVSIKQFRAPGRFNWVFYYVATLMASVAAYRFYTYLKHRHLILGYAFIIPVCAIWFCDMNMVVLRWAQELGNNAQKVDETADGVELLQKLKESGKSVKDFQAMLALPFFLNGSEKLYITSPSVFGPMETSLNTGLPLIDGEMSRTSLGRTLNIADILSGELIHKNVIDNYRNNRPLLLVAEPNQEGAAGQKLKSRAGFLFSWHEANFYELPLSAFDDTITRAIEYIRTEGPSLFHHAGYDSNDSVEDVVFNGFENEPVDYAILGAGAHYSKDAPVQLFSGTLPNARDSTTYEISIWQYADGRIPSFPGLYFTQKNSEGRTIAMARADGSQSTNNYGSWVRVSINFELYNSNDSLSVYSSGNFATYDEFMIRPDKENVIVTPIRGSLFTLNNYPLRKNLIQK